MSNDYEYLGDSQMPPPVAPRPPTDAPPELLTGLPHTPALKANDDVDLESNRPRGNNNLSFSDGLNPKRSEPSVATTKTSRSTESDEESRKETRKESKEEKKPAKGGTCWCIFAAATIFLAVISLLGLSAFLIMNMDGEVSISAALNGTNETSTAPFETTTPVQVIVPAKIIPLDTSTVLPPIENTTPLVMKTTESSDEETTTMTTVETTESIGTSTVLLNTPSENTTTSSDFPPVATSSSNLPTSTASADVSSSTESTLEDALPIEDDTTQSDATVEASTSSSEDLTTTVTTDAETTSDWNELSTTASLSLNATSTEKPSDEISIPN